MGSIVKILLEKIPKFEIESFKTELGISRDYRQQESIPKARRKFTYLSQNPAFRRYHIPLLPYMFTKYICSWHGSPHDCYLMHRCANEGPEAQLREDDGLRVVEDSNDID